MGDSLYGQEPRMSRLFRVTHTQFRLSFCCISVCAQTVGRNQESRVPVPLGVWASSFSRRAIGLLRDRRKGRLDALFPLADGDLGPDPGQEILDIDRLGEKLAHSESHSCGSGGEIVLRRE